MNFTPNTQSIPLISIIVPVYNAEEYLGQCLDSILAQTYTHLEIILINDGSTDNSKQICDIYALKDKRIKVIHQPNKGVAYARNAGLALARGEYIGFVDSDDFIGNDMYRYLLKLILQDNADIAMCNLYKQTSGGWQKDSQIHAYYNIIKPTQIFSLSSWAYLVVKLFKHSILKPIHFDVNASYNEDGLFIFHSLQRAKSIAIGQEAFYYYRYNTNSATNNFKRSHLYKIKIENQFLIFAKQHKLWGFYINTLRSQLGSASTWLGWLALESSPDQEAVQILISYLRQYILPFLFITKEKLLKKCFIVTACINFTMARYVYHQLIRGKK